MAVARSAKKSTTKQKVPVKCKLCLTVLSNKQDLPRHMKLHTLDPKWMHYCTYDGCTYKTLQKSNLVDHLVTHTDETPFCCPLCDACYKSRSARSRHKTLVHGEPKPDTTEEKSMAHCDEPFSRDSSVESFDSSSTSSFSFVEFHAALPPSSSLETRSPSSPPSELSCATPGDEPYSYPWNIEKQSEVPCDSDMASLPPLVRSPSPKQLFSGSQVRRTFQEDAQPRWFPLRKADFGILPPLSRGYTYTQTPNAFVPTMTPSQLCWPQSNYSGNDAALPAAGVPDSPMVYAANVAMQTWNVDQVPMSPSQQFTCNMNGGSFFANGSQGTQHLDCCPFSNPSCLMESRCYCFQATSVTSSQSSDMSDFTVPIPTQDDFTVPFNGSLDTKYPVYDQQDVSLIHRRHILASHFYYQMLANGYTESQALTVYAVSL